ncbi:DNA/RNA non-specific endonuclease [Microbacterium sp.]|uniref:DNA/RNA non-specific endonuclease n=1 Tax=Microbacterium sp. TaxID=51671 RepID=UPI0037364F2C
MSALKPIFREVRQAGVKAAGDMKDRLRGVADNLSTHVTTVGRRVVDEDRFDDVVTRRGGNSKTTHSDPSTGRPVRESGIIREDFGSSTRGDNATAIGHLGRSGDDGGHIGAHRFFGDTPDEGIVPQAANLNRGAWKRMENEWANWTAKGYEVSYDIDVYPPGAVRPDSFEVTYTVTDPSTGTVAYRNWPSFWNESGEAFDAIHPRDMPDLP